MKYLINKRFGTSVDRTSRVLEVGEAFGIGMDDKEFVVYDNLELEVEPGDVIYITGQSGSGKSILLRELAKQMAANGMRIGNIDEIHLPEKPLVDQIGKSTSEALEILSRVGLNDAYLFIRRPSELSDGQKYRMKLAHLIYQESDVWVADEFGAVLDRVTAKVVSFSIAKLARTLKKTLIVATTHTDIGEELAPNLRIDKRFREKLKVEHQ